MTTIIEREVGERVSITLGFDPSLTKELADGVIETVVTTSTVDRHNENILTDGIDVTSYLENPVVLYGHDYQGLPIGKTLSLTATKNKMKAKFQLAVEEYPFAKTVYDLIKGGYLNAVSIGGVVREWSDDYRTIEKMEMVEFSVVPVPANPQAIITARSLENATGKSVDEISKEYHDFQSEMLIDKLKSLDDDEVSETVKTLKRLTVALEESEQARSSAGNLDEKVKRVRTVKLLKDAKAISTESNKLIRHIKITLPPAEKKES